LLGFTDPSGHEGSGLIVTAARGFYNLVSQATGLGITRRIIDCSNFLIATGVRRLCKRIRGADRVRRTCDQLISRDIYAPAAARSLSVIIGRIVRPISGGAVDCHGEDILQATVQPYHDLIQPAKGDALFASLQPVQSRRR
jgi:hypothetical protein